MARELAQLGDEVHIIAPYSVEPDPIPGVTVHRFRLPPINYHNILGHILIVLKAWTVARRIPALQVIHAPEYLTTGIIAPLSRIPVVLTTPGNIYERLAKKAPVDWTLIPVYKLAARSSARFCLFVDAISLEMAHWWRMTGTPENRIEVIPLGVDVGSFSRHADARSDLHLDPKRFLALYLGRLSSEKNVDVFLDAIRLVRETGRDIAAAIVGSGPEEQALRASVRDMRLDNDVTFFGQRPYSETPLWYSAADVVVLPSSSEGLPRVMLEAMACGAPFVGTPVSGIADQIRSGRNGLIVDLRDSAALVPRVSSTLRRPYRCAQNRRRGRYFIYANI